MNIGKLTNSELEALILSKFRKTRKEVKYPPMVGIDCAQVDVGGVCVLSSDPITAATSRIGYLTVHINCNDAAAAGAEPIGLMVTLLAPTNAEKSELSAVAEDIAKAAYDANVDIIGGHTEFTPAVNRIITSATVIAKPVCALEGLKCGDDIVITKSAALEGTAVIANDCQDRLSLSADELETAKNMVNSLSVIPEGMYAAKHGAHAMHDVTEGGVLGALWELCYSAGLGCITDTDAIPIEPVTEKICTSLGIDPYRLLSSGAMLIACENGEEMIKGLSGIGIKATVIAKVTEGGIRDTKGNIIEPPEADELYKVF